MHTSEKKALPGKKPFSGLKAFPVALCFAAAFLAVNLTVAACSDQSAKENKTSGTSQPASAQTAGQSSGGTALESAALNGETVYRAASCGTCHTPDMLGLFARQLDLKTFASIVRDGVRADGSKVFDVMPSAFYTNMTDADAQNLYAFALSHMDGNEAAVMQEKWQKAEAAFDSLHEAGSVRVKPVPAGDAARGEYLVTAVGRCAQCHAEAPGAALSGGAYQGWDAYNITSDPVGGIGEWSRAALVLYLKDGITKDKGTAAGPMADVITHGTALLDDGDLNAMADTLLHTEGVNNSVSGKARTSFGKPVAEVHDLRTLPAAMGDATPLDGKALYNANCASCHGWKGDGVKAGELAGYPAMFHNSSTGADSAANFTQVVLGGLKRDTPRAHVVMPPFGRDMTDDEVSALVNYVTGQFGNPDATVTPQDVKKLR